MLGMCGRFSNGSEFSEIRIQFDATDFLAELWTPRLNISPSYGHGFEVPMVRLEKGQRVARLARWWLIPSWWKKPLRELPAAFNARGEELTQKPFFRSAFATRRCIIPATGWREFVGPTKKKQPHQFHFGHRLFGFAGLTETWVSPEGEVVDSCTIVTMAPTPQAAPIHDRMPLVLTPHLYEAWLDPKAHADAVLAEAMAEVPSLALEIYASNPVGNSTKFEGPEVLELAPGPT